MASLSLDGSPTPRKGAPANFFIYDEVKSENDKTHTSGGVVGLQIDSMYHPNPAANLDLLQQALKRDSYNHMGPGEAMMPLTTSRMGNQLPPPPPPPTTRQSSFKVSTQDLRVVDLFYDCD